MKYLGVDLGTTNTSIYLKNQGIVFKEPSVVTIDVRSNYVICTGNEAKLMIGKTPEPIKTVCPIQDGVIAEFDATAEMLSKCFKQIAGSNFFSRPKIVAAVSNNITEVEKRAVQDVMLEAGAQAVALVEKSLAAACGTGMKIENARGGMIVDIGGGTTEAAIISFGGVVLSKSIRIAGDEIDEAIVHYLKQRYNVLIAKTAAEVLKRQICSIYPANDVVAEITGRNLSNGLPAVLPISAIELRDAIADPINEILTLIKQTLEAAPPETASDVFDLGIILTGGTSYLPGLSSLIEQFTSIPTTVARRPLDSVVSGIGRIMDSPTLSQLIQYRNR